MLLCPLLDPSKSQHHNNNSSNILFLSIDLMPQLFLAKSISLSTYSKPHNNINREGHQIWPRLHLFLHGQTWTEQSPYLPPFPPWFSLAIGDSLNVILLMLFPTSTIITICVFISLTINESGKKKETRIAFKLLFSHILIFPRRRKCATDFPLWELRRRKWSCTILVTLCRFFFRFFIFFPFYFYLSTALFEFSKMWKNSNDKLMEPYVYLKEIRKTVQNPIIHTKQRYRSK